MNWRVPFCLLPTALAPFNAHKYRMQQKVVVRARCRLFCCTLHHIPDLRKSFGIFFLFETTKTFTSRNKASTSTAKNTIGIVYVVAQKRKRIFTKLSSTFAPQYLLDENLCDLKLLMMFSSSQYDPTLYAELEVLITQAHTL